MSPIFVLARMVWLELFRRKDPYVLLLVLAALLAALLSFDVFGLGSLVRYIKDAGLLLTWLLSWVLAIQLAGRQLPQEETRHTIFSLVAKPISRAELVLGKWLGSWLAAGAGTVLLYAATWLAVGLRGGTFGLTTLAQALLLHLFFLAIITALSIALSTRLTQSAATTVAYLLTGAGYFLAARLPAMALGATPLKNNALFVFYYAIPHLELFDLRQRLVHDWGPLPGGILLGILGYGLLWIASLLLLAWLAYRRRRFTRGEMT